MSNKINQHARWQKIQSKKAERQRNVDIKMTKMFETPYRRSTTIAHSIGGIDVKHSERRSASIDITYPIDYSQYDQIEIEGMMVWVSKGADFSGLEN